MVQNRFIAILGGCDRENWTFRQCAESKLFALNCKQSISLKPMLKPRYSGTSDAIYDEHGHRIIVHDKYGWDYYDINKDEWISAWSDDEHRLRNSKLWISNYNPKVLYFAGHTDASYDENEYKVEVIKYDMRSSDSLDVDCHSFVFNKDWFAFEMGFLP